eukprot:gb/GEZN01015426.1/.p1 GENE.gb/GEZN01015426.1/~~gb/GEZN01015426.1/.p1  ORF type:complete len:209 (+),score=17.88 gb/GEZN01015426.1/:102-728(+)
MNRFFNIPPITKIYVAGSILTTTACALDLVSPFTLYYSPHLVFQKFQVWRLFTNFFFFGGQINLNFLFHMFFLVRYCSALEERCFRDRIADFVWLFIFGASLFLLFAPIANARFLGSALTFMMVYIWGRRNPHGRIDFLGLPFTAPYLPWVLVTLSLLLGHDIASDVMGIIVGHLYYFLEDVYPRMIPSRRRFLKTPRILELLLQSEE